MQFLIPLGLTKILIIYCLRQICDLPNILRIRSEDPMLNKSVLAKTFLVTLRMQRNLCAKIDSYAKGGGPKDALYHHRLHG